MTQTRGIPKYTGLILTNEEGMINKITPLPPIGNIGHICLNVFTSMYTEEPMAPQPRLNLFKGNYGKISEDMQSIDWDTTLHMEEKTEQHIPIPTKQKNNKNLYTPKARNLRQKRGTAGTYTQNLTTQWTMQYLPNYKIKSKGILEVCPL